MRSQIEEDVSLILTLLNNVEELITISNDRKDARKVLDAILIFAKGNQIEIPISLIEELKSNLLDYPPKKIEQKVKSIAQKTYNLNVVKKKTSKNKIKTV
jgi:hypothetical protein